MYYYTGVQDSRALQKPFRYRPISMVSGKTNHYEARPSCWNFVLRKVPSSDTSVKRLKNEWDLKKTRLESIDAYAAAVTLQFPQIGAQELTNSLRLTYNIRVPR